MFTIAAIALLAGITAVTCMRVMFENCADGAAEGAHNSVYGPRHLYGPLDSPGE